MFLFISCTFRFEISLEKSINMFIHVTQLLSICWHFLAEPRPLARLEPLVLFGRVEARLRLGCQRHLFVLRDDAGLRAILLPLETVNGLCCDFVKGSAMVKCRHFFSHILSDLANCQTKTSKHITKYDAWSVFFRVIWYQNLLAELGTLGKLCRRVAAVAPPASGTDAAQEAAQSLTVWGIRTYCIMYDIS